MQKISLSLTVLAMATLLLEAPAIHAQIDRPSPTMTSNPTGAATEILLTAKAGDYHVTVGGISSGIPVGKNRLDLTVTDDHGVAVSNASVGVRMTPRNGNGSPHWSKARSVGSGHYQASVKVTTPGAYIAEVSVSRQGVPHGSAQFTVNVGSGETPAPR